MNPLTQFKKVPILPLLITLGLVALASPKLAQADAVTDWNAIASTAIVTNAGQPPHPSLLSFAMVQGAVYDAVNAIDRGHQPYLVQPPSNPTDSKEAAASTAAFRVLVGFDDLPGLFPAQLLTWQPVYDAYIANLPDDPPGSRDAGVTIGETTARAMLEARLNDGRFGPPPDLYPPAPGIWRRTPPNYASDAAPAPTGRTRSPALLTRRTSTRLRRSAHCTARPERPTRPKLQSFGRIMDPRFGIGSFARWQPART